MGRQMAGPTRSTSVVRQLHHTRALRNMRSHGESPFQSAGRQLRFTARGVRSGCGIMIVKRPSAVVDCYGAH